MNKFSYLKNKKTNKETKQKRKKKKRVCNIYF